MEIRFHCARQPKFCVALPPVVVADSVTVDAPVVFAHTLSAYRKFPGTASVCATAPRG